jgi:hypothetical protein
LRRLVQDPRWNPNLQYEEETGSDDGETDGTILHMAVETANAKGDTTAVELILESGADLEAVDSEGRTPLSLAENVHVYRFLVERGSARRNCGKSCNTYGFTANDFTANHVWFYGKLIQVLRQIM